MDSPSPWIIISLPGMELGLITHTWNLDSQGKVDPFLREWTAAPKVVEFYERHGITLIISHSTRDPKIWQFHFPSDRKDIAALFKLAFS